MWQEAWLCGGPWQVGEMPSASYRSALGDCLTLHLLLLEETVAILLVALRYARDTRRTQVSAAARALLPTASRGPSYLHETFVLLAVFHFLDLPLDLCLLLLARERPLLEVGC